MAEGKKGSSEMMPYTPITENPIRIDLKEWKSYLDIFGLLKRKLGLPGNCGENWDAIWDVVWHLSDEPVMVEFYGVAKARERFPEDVEIMVKIFHDLHKGWPNIEYVVID